MKGLRHSSQPSDLDRTLALIEQSPVTPDDVLVNTLLDACTSNGAMADARLALREAAEAGLAPAMSTYMSMLRQCAQKKDMEAALQVYEEMPFPPDLAAFN